MIVSLYNIRRYAETGQQLGAAGFTRRVSVMGSDTESGDRTAWAERAVERLSEDETLRGSLEDDGYGPLLNVTAALAIARVGKVASVDELYLAVRRLLVEAVASAECGVSTSLIGAARPLLTEKEVLGLRRAIPPLGRDRNGNARRIARTLAEVTGVKAASDVGDT
jgi:hypothetical protein